MRTCHVLRISRIRYLDALGLQLRLVEQVRSAQSEDAALLLLEHEPVVTIGRSGTAGHLRVTREELARRGVELHESNRGGDVTYHGPGQIVGYPILYLPEGKRDVHRFLRSVEAVVIGALARFGIQGQRVAGYTGVWVACNAECGMRNAELARNGSGAAASPIPHSALHTPHSAPPTPHSELRLAKIAAIGVAFRRWTSHHGFALNVATDLAAFDLIVPCGIADRPVTSMERLLGHAPARNEVEDALIAEFLLEFGFAAARECSSADDLLSRSGLILPRGAGIMPPEVPESEGRRP